MFKKNQEKIYQTICYTKLFLVKHHSIETDCKDLKYEEQEHMALKLVISETQITSIQFV